MGREDEIEIPSEQEEEVSTVMMKNIPCSCTQEEIIEAINEVGLGDDAVTKDCATIAKEVSVYKKPVLAPLDFRTKPEFTLGLSDRRVTQGYNGLLSCALKGFPKPKLRWYKGKIEINDNPKYKTTFSEGIVQLEIRRAQMAEGGVYKLVATNEMGEASCECQVTIREVS